MYRSIILSASASCFVACPGCYNYFGKHVIDTPTIIAFMKTMHQRYGTTKVTVGGGDPLTRPDIIDLLQALKELGLKLHLDTVGTAFLGNAHIKFMGKGIVPQVNCAEVARIVTLIGIPLDGSTDEVSQKFRVFSHVQEQERILQLLENANADVCINTVVHKGNVEDLIDIQDILQRYTSVVEWQLFQFMPIGPLGYKNHENYEITIDAFNCAVGKVQQRNRSSANPIRIVPKSKETRKGRYLLIDSEGNLWIPRQSFSKTWDDNDRNDQRIVIGNISQTDIFTILDEFVQCSQMIHGV